MRRFNLIALLIFIGGLVWVFTFDNQTTRKIQRSVGSIFSSATRAGAKAQEAVTGGSEEPKTPDQLREENEKLRREVDDLRLKQQYQEKLESSNKELSDMLDFKRRYGLKLVAAEIINRKVSAWYREGIIDKGLRDKVYEGTPVITPVRMEREAGSEKIVWHEAALVGKIGSAENDSAKVVFVTDERCSVSATVKGMTHVHGILMGSRSSTKRVPDLRLRFIRPENTVLDESNEIISENLGGVFPFGILLGQVKQFQLGDGNPEALVTPAVDFESLRYVFVLQQEEAPAETPPAAAKRK